MVKAYFAGGCFWGVEFYMKRIPGVLNVISGYSGGDERNPTYEDVCSKKTGHAETVEVEYDDKKVKYADLVWTFFRIHDFTQVNRQGPDIGAQYRSEIFYVNEEQRIDATEIIEELKGRGYDIATQLTPFKAFWPAEDYHQNYYEKKGGEPYCHYPRNI